MYKRNKLRGKLQKDHQEAANYKDILGSDNSSLPAWPDCSQLYYLQKVFGKIYLKKAKVTIQILFDRQDHKQTERQTEGWEGRKQAPG